MPSALQYNLNLRTQNAQRAIDALYNRANNAFNKKGVRLNVQIGAPLGRITNDLSQFNRSLEASNARVIAFGASTGVIYSVQKAFRSLISDTIAVEKSLKNINVILQAGTSTFGKFSSELFQIASNTGQAFDVAAEAAGEFARQGLSIERTLQATNAALILTRQTGLDAEKSVTALTAAVNTFDREGLTHIDVVNKMASVDAAFAVSSADLAEGLKRVGSSAVDAGLSLDQMQAAIAATQQISARGGAIIGNAFKTILARLQTSEVQNALNNIGIATKDATGEFRNAIDILQDLESTLGSLGAQQRADVIEKIAGKRQINTLRAFLASLRGDYSLFDKALAASANSANAAVLRNEELNETLDAMLVKTSNVITEFNAAAGQITFAPIIKSLSNSVNSIFQPLTEALGKDDAFASAGEQLIKGLFAGISNVIAGPGLAVLSALAGKVITTLGKDLAQGFGSLAGGEIKGKSQILDLYNKLGAAEKQRLASATTLAERQRIFNDLIKEEIALRRQQSAFINQTAAATPRGLRNQLAGLRSFAGGHIPSFATEAEAIEQGVGGAKKSAKPRVVKVNLGKGPERVIVNTDEYIVDKFKGTNQSAIFNQNMLKEIGGISNLKKYGKVRKVFAGGYIPSFSNGKSPLASAISREVIALAESGYPMADIAGSVKVGSSNALVSASNPMGLGVYNTLQGQYSIGKAMNDHGGESQSGVPNMATPQDLADRFLRDLRGVKLRPGQENRASAQSLIRYNKEIQKQVNALEKAGKSTKAFSKTLLQSQAEISKREGIARGASNQQLFARQGNAFARREIRRRLDAEAAPRRLEEEKRLLENEKRAADAKIRAEKEFANRIDKIGKFRINGPLEAAARASGVDPKSATFRQARQDLVNRRNESLGRVGFGAAFALPLVGGVISQQLGRDTQQGKAVDTLTSSLGAGLSLALFGPLGIAIGGVVATFGALNASAELLRDNFEQEAKEAQTRIDNRREQLQAAEQFATSRDQLQQLLRDPNASASAIARVTQSQNEAFSGITDSDLRNDIVKAINDGGDVSLKLAELLQIQNELNNKSQTANDLLFAVRSNLDRETNSLEVLGKFFGAEVKQSLGDVLNPEEQKKLINSVVKLADTSKIDEGTLRALQDVRGGTTTASLSELLSELKDIFPEEAFGGLQAAANKLADEVSGGGQGLAIAVARNLIASRDFSNALSRGQTDRSNFAQSITSLKSVFDSFISQIKIVDSIRSTQNAAGVEQFVSALENQFSLSGSTGQDDARLNFVKSVFPALSQFQDQARNINTQVVEQLSGLANSIKDEDTRNAFVNELTNFGKTFDTTKLIDIISRSGDDQLALQQSIQNINYDQFRQQAQLVITAQNQLAVQKGLLDSNLKLIEKTERNQKFQGREFDDFDEIIKSRIDSIFEDSSKEEKGRQERLRVARVKGGASGLLGELDAQGREKLEKNRATVNAFEDLKAKGLLPTDPVERQALQGRVEKARKNIFNERERQSVSAGFEEVFSRLEEALGSNVASDFRARVQGTLIKFFEETLAGNSAQAALQVNELGGKVDSFRKGITGQSQSQVEGRDVLTKLISILGFSTSSLIDTNQGVKDVTSEDFATPSKKLADMATSADEAGKKLNSLGEVINKILSNFPVIQEQTQANIQFQKQLSAAQQEVNTVSQNRVSKKAELASAEDQVSAGDIALERIKELGKLLKEVRVRYPSARDLPFENFTNLVQAFKGNDINTVLKLQGELDKFVSEIDPEALGVNYQIPKNFSTGLDTSFDINLYRESKKRIEELKREINTLDSDYGRARGIVQSIQDAPPPSIGNIDTSGLQQTINLFDQTVGTNLNNAVSKLEQTLLNGSVNVQNTIDHNLRVQVAFNSEEIQGQLRSSIEGVIVPIIKQMINADRVADGRGPSSAAELNTQPEQ